jgi:hypothetical protein
VAGLGVDLDIDLDIDLGSDSMNTEHGFIAVAKRQFAKNGLGHTSIASIADELALTKQALLHHCQVSFGRSWQRSVAQIC